MHHHYFTNIYIFTILQNVEYGMASVFQLMRDHILKRHHQVLHLDLTYGATKYALQRLCEQTGSQLVEVSLPTRLTRPGQVAEVIDEALGSGAGNSKFLVIEHITSPTGIVLPIRDIVKVAHSYGVLVLVDGAHGLGQVDLDLTALNADFYVSNGHKFLCNARGAGILHCSARKHRDLLIPTITSWGAKQGFSAEFIWQGTCDYVPYLTMRIALRLLAGLGGATPEASVRNTDRKSAVRRVMSRNKRLCAWAAEMICAVWNTTTIVSVDMFASMAAIYIPDPFSSSDSGAPACSFDSACSNSRPVSPGSSNSFTTELLSKYGMHTNMLYKHAALFRS